MAIKSLPICGKRVDEHLNQKTSIKLLGPGRIEMTDLPKIKETAGDFEIIVETSNSDTQSNKSNCRKGPVLSKYQQAPFINPKVLFEIEAEAVGLKGRHKEMLNLDDSNVDIQVEAHRISKRA